ncbi:MAG: LysR family transcriptional regulator [Burkholderia sp.]
MNKLTSIRTFVKVAECMSFAKAAKQLGVSASVVTRSVAELEKHLGVLLVNRTTRSAALTPSGELYWKQCTEVLRLLDDMDACVTHASSLPARTLRIAASAAFASTDLPALLAAHRSIEPHTAFDLTVYDAIGDVSVADYDVCFSTERRLRDSSMICRSLSHTEEVVVASPDYLARRGEPRAPEEMSGHDVLLSTDAPSTYWDFHDDHGACRAIVRPVLNLQPPLMVKRAVIAGLGIARLPADIVGEALADGKLRQLFGALSLRDARRTIWMLYARQPHRGYSIRHFVDFVVERYRHAAPAAAAADAAALPADAG